MLGCWGSPGYVSQLDELLVEQRLNRSLPVSLWTHVFQPLLKLARVHEPIWIAYLLWNITSFYKEICELIKTIQNNLLVLELFIEHIN